MECTSDEQQLMTNAADPKSCVVVESSFSLLEMLFADGVAYYVAFASSVMFVAVCGLMQYMRYKRVVAGGFRAGGESGLGGEADQHLAAQLVSSGDHCSVAGVWFRQ